MSAVVIDIAEAVRGELNHPSRTWSTPFEAERLNAPNINREDLRELKVTVSPKSRTSAPLTRDRMLKTYEVFVGLQQFLASECDAETDPLIALGEEIAEFFEMRQIAVGNSVAFCNGSRFGDGADSVLMSLQDRDSLFQYTGVIVLSFVMHR